MKNNFSVILLFISIIVIGLILYFCKDETKKILIDNNIIKEEQEEIDPYKEYKDVQGFKLANLDRYIKYKSENENLSYEKIVTYVNIGLDYEFYSYISDADITKDNLILMNKYLKLDEDYEPDDLEEINSKYFIDGNYYVRKLRKDAKEAFEKLCAAANKDGYSIYGQSAYRPYEMQKKLYDSAVDYGGIEYADSDTARPGHSEHQTGLAIDVSSTKNGNMMSFENTDSFKWMMENAHKFGFILRYTKGYENIHGYIYEPWHYRYVGIEVATDMNDNYPDMTYEEYYYKFIEN